VSVRERWTQTITDVLELEGASDSQLGARSVPGFPLRSLLGLE
jgi:hypothetical protein